MEGFGGGRFEGEGQSEGESEREGERGREDERERDDEDEGEGEGSSGGKVKGKVPVYGEAHCQICCRGSCLCEVVRASKKARSEGRPSARSIMMYSPACELPVSRRSLSKGRGRRDARRIRASIKSSNCR